MTSSSNTAQKPNRTSLITYLIRLYDKNDIHNIKLRIARYSLFLFFVREIKYKPETALKRNIVSTLYNSRGLILVEKRKLYKSFHNKKKIDTIITYSLYRNPPAVKPYPALDKAVVYLLITGKFSEKFSL
ncbi:hypothetical protein N7449_005105 [Penicillium cf. viridicatum]|uniref:Uncharacterized protein n=1 Tax=Penicillium cf. viridicatum TaxID=2972119 RepID=A0A9W9MKG8_9EURO|nr:hypothetical protein N7449_005105 [Penicillium cf. viridicatum]